MRKIRPENLQHLYDIRNLVIREIQKLQLTGLPHLKLLMLLERAEELRHFLDISIEATLSSPVELSKSTSEAIQKLLKMLIDLSLKSKRDLQTAEMRVSYANFPRLIARYKKEARELASQLANFASENKLIVIDQFTNRWKILENAVKDKTDEINRLNLWAEHNINRGILIVEKFFSILDKHPDLVDVYCKIREMLKESSYQNISKSDLFDIYFYTSHLPDKEKNIPDKIIHYIDNEEPHQPHQFFNPSWYKKIYPEVDKLHYLALEHFIRYGEAFFYSPNQDFDTTYYMEANEDVMDAGISPFRHFLQHGLAEGRPPCPKAGHYFIKQHLEPIGVTLGFIRLHEYSSNIGLTQLQTHCAARKNSIAVDIDANHWTGNDSDLDAFVIGTQGASRLRNEVLQNVAESGRLVLYIGDNPQKDLDELLHQSILPLERLFAVTSNYERFLRWQESNRPLKLLFYDFTDPARDVPFIEALLNRLAEKQAFCLRRIGQWDTTHDTKPAISIVSIIYKKCREMIAFLESLNRQDLARPFEVVLVDDASPDDSVRQIEHWLKEKQQSGLLNAHMTLRILCNPTNSGNCTSRNRGIEASLADIVLVADGDVVMSTSCLSEHLWAYRLGDCDATIGFFRFNMDYNDVFQWLAASETNAEIVRKQILSDSYSYIRQLPNSIYNFVTRNTSFKKSSFNGSYFDTSFNYTSDINSGYGEEDHEIAARLYFDRKNIRFVEKSICVHIRHGDNSYNANKAISNLRNWNRLIDKYPDLTLVDRQYYQWRTRNLLMKASEMPNKPEVQIARKRYEDPYRTNIIVPRAKPLRVLINKCDIPYQYDLFKMRHFFTLLDKVDLTVADGWDYNLRPCPYNVTFTSFDKVNPSKFDLAILTFDSDALLLTEGPSPLHVWGQSLMRMLELTREIPRIALCYSSAASSGKRNGEQCSMLDTQRAKRKALLRVLLEDIHVVCTSYQLQQDWGFSRSTVIWHGFSPQEYPEGTHTDHCLTLPHKTFIGDSVETLHLLKAKLADVCPLECLAPPAPLPEHLDSKQNRAIADYQNYAKYLGKFAIHLTPLDRPSMPTCRTEAMLTGSIPVTLRNDDVDIFIQNGVNGFVGDSIDELISHIRWLQSNENRRRKISRNARITAMDIFNVDRCLASWLNIFHNFA